MAKMMEAAAEYGPATLDDLIRREIDRTHPAARELERATRFLASARGRDPKAYQALPRRMRRLVDLLAAA